MNSKACEILKNKLKHTGFVNDEDREAIKYAIAKLTLLDEAEKQIAELKAKELSWIETSHKLKAEISRLKENLHLVGIVLKEKNKDLEISRLKIGLDVEKVKVKESK